MTKIAWTDKTWNPIRGCGRVSAGCKNCYAERFAHRNLGGHYEGLTRMTAHGPRWTGEVRCIPEKLNEPLRWWKPRRVFVNSMSDLFHEKVPDEFIIGVFNTMRRAHQHVYQILTKRPQRMRDFCSRLRFDGSGSGLMWLADTPDGAGYRLMGGNGCTGMPWVWLGVSVENQQTADERIPLLLETPATVRWVSYEPALGPVNLRMGDRCAACGGPSTQMKRLVCDDCGRLWSDAPLIDWLVVGAESGPGPRPCDVEWIRSVVQECKAAGVSCFVKQLGKRSYCDGGRGWVNNKHPKGADPAEWPEDLRVREFPA